MLNKNHCAGTSEKFNVALISLLAAIFLTGIKIVVGVITGSLGIIAEAAHSALDLLAAIVTLFAVKTSGKPPDGKHNYGYGKIENLSALGETFLLLVTCVWIIYEAIERLFFQPVKVEANFLAFIVVLISIVVDFNRSAKLQKVAKKYNSQALEADALHFRTDLWSSGVVFIGLLCVKMAEYYPSVSWLKSADSIAALIVAFIAIWISIQLGKTSALALLDSAPSGLEAKIRAQVEALSGIANCHSIRIRSSGPSLFIDLHVYIDGTTTLTEAHLKTEYIEDEIRKIVPMADITVHPEPTPAGYENR